ncbi:MAG: peptide-methionine (S)-S-oxide reductase [Armatimonadota bacterium]
MRGVLFLVPALALGAFMARHSPAHDPSAAILKVGGRAGNAGAGTPLRPLPGHELAAFAMGCFWGSEDIYRKVPGVTATSVGYTGGFTPNPTYEEVCTGRTGHAEVVLVVFDPAAISYEELLRIFWENHDSTSGDRQGPDVGDSYRSAIYTIGADQAKLADATSKAFQQKLRMKITTEIKPLGQFWLAENYHQQYHERTHTATCPFPKPPKKKGA